MTQSAPLTQRPRLALPESWSTEPPVLPHLVLPKVKRILLTKSLRTLEPSRAGRCHALSSQSNSDSFKNPLNVSRERPSLVSGCVGRRLTPDYPPLEGPDHEGPGECLLIFDKIQCFKSVREISIVDLSRLTHKFNNS